MICTWSGAHHHYLLGVLYPVLNTSGLLPAEDEDNEDSDDDVGLNGGVAAASIPA